MTPSPRTKDRKPAQRQPRRRLLRPSEAELDDALEAKALLAAGQERRRAEKMWKKRMGAARWRDDPRALAEKMRTEFYSHTLLESELWTPSFL